MTTRTVARVVHVTWRLSDVGGIPIVIRRLTTALDPALVETHVITVRPAVPEDALDQVSATVHPLGFAGRPTARVHAGVAARAAVLARRLRSDVIHAHSGTAMLTLPAALLARPRVRLLDVHDAPGHGRHGRRTEWLEGALCRWFGYRPIAHSSAVVAECVAAWRLSEPPVLVPLGIPTGDFDAGARRLRADDACKTVLYVARLVASKDVRTFIDVAARVTSELPTRAVRFAVVADGPERDALQAEVDRRGLGGTVALERARTGAALVDAYRDADVFLSTSAYEGFGLAIVEAMAAGLPVVATAVGGVTDLVVDGETGVLAPAGDLDALAAGVSALLADPERAHELGAAGRERARRQFDVAAMAAGYERLYRSAVPARRVVVLKSPVLGPHTTSGPLPYRIDLLEQEQLALDWTDRHRRRPFTSQPLAKLIGGTERLATPWLQTALLLPSIARADATLAFFESEANALAVLRTIVPRLRRRAFVVLTCWLADLIDRAPERARRYRRAYGSVDRLVYFSSNQGAILAAGLGLDHDRLRFVAFGVDDERFRPLDGADAGYVACVGRDRGRDWATFMTAAGRAGLPVKVACRPADLAGVAVPPNVELLGYVDPDRYRSLIGRARISVVPTFERVYPTGQSVALESMAMARATIVTSTEAMRDYLEDGVNGVGVPVGDADALASAMTSLFDDAASCHRLGQRARAAVETRFNARAMWGSIAEVIDEAVSERSVIGRAGDG